MCQRGQAVTDINTIYSPDRISLREVGLRDGLQMVKTFPTTQGKIDWIHQEYDAGIRHFELGTFLPKERYPVFADIQLLIDTVAALPGAYGSGLSPNKIGSQNALSSGISEIHCVVSVSEAHNLANLKRTRKLHCAKSLIFVPGVPRWNHRLKSVSA